VQARETKDPTENPSIQNKIRQSIHGRIIEALKKRGKRKEFGLLNCLGCSIAEFRTHLQSQFSADMSWAKYGFYVDANGVKQMGFHIDHIIPCCAFDLTDPVQVLLCFNWRNCQPLWGRENLSKSGRFNTRDKMDYIDRMKNIINAEEATRLLEADKRQIAQEELRIAKTIEYHNQCLHRQQALYQEYLHEQCLQGMQLLFFMNESNLHEKAYKDPANWTPQIATSTSPPQVVWFLSFDSSAPGWCISTVVQNQMMYLSSSNLASDSPSNLYTPILTATFPLTTSEYWWMDATSYSVGPPQGKGTFGVPGSSFSPYYLFSASNPSTTPACFPSIPPQPCPPPPAIPPPITINWDMAQMPLGQCGCGDWTFGIPACVINAPTISNGANYSTYVDNFSNPCCASEESPASITLNTNVPPGSTVNVNANQTCCCDCNLRVVNESNYPVYINDSYSGGTVQGYIFPTNNTSAYQCGLDNSQVYTQVGWNNGSGSPQSLCPSGTVYIGDQVADFAMDSLEDCLGDPECVEALAPDD